MILLNSKVIIQTIPNLFSDLQSISSFSKALFEIDYQNGSN